ncbi:uncharacterized protein LOC125234356 [Leguminivora glycinivorella]|uniref:uncharacterized protein LOC125234356 n=1 Tax=Leguminivora glycinivorella TaxID=1035111 RepID=UPI00200C3879|nr:uncharacterized protein LOC125234356 [Leguminivora glycinivorella]
MLMILTLVGVLTSARADCDACFQGVCHVKKIVLEGFRVTDQLAIDRTDNILYAQLDYRTTAIFLDEARIRTVDDQKSTGLAVDQKNQILYSSLDGVIYRHRHQDNGYITETAFLLDRATTPARLRYEDVLYTINEDGSSGYYSEHSNSFAGYDNLENFAVTDMVNVKNITNWFFVAGDKLYRYILDDYNHMSWHLISGNKHILSIGKYGDVYFGDADEKIIYKLDRDTKELVKYGNYVDGYLEDFVFDRDENIVFLDADGSVARWIPSGGVCDEADESFQQSIENDEDVVLYYSDFKKYLQRYNYRTSARDLTIDVIDSTNDYSIHISNQNNDQRPTSEEVVGPISLDDESSFNKF